VLLFACQCQHHCIFTWLFLCVHLSYLSASLFLLLSCFCFPPLPSFHGWVIYFHWCVMTFLAILAIWRTVNVVSITLLVQLFMTQQLKRNCWIIFPKWKSTLPNPNVSLVLYCEDSRLWTGNHSACTLERSWWIYTRR
jgi:hypothetical protein